MVEIFVARVALAFRNLQILLSRIAAIREERASSDHSSDPRSSFLGNLSELSQESGDLEA